MAYSLPQFILLKSIKRDKYLRYRKEDDSNHAFLQFSGDEKEENVEIQYVKFQVQKSETMEGYVHIRTLYNNKYWIRKCGDNESKPCIAAEANEPEEDPSKPECTLFQSVLVERDGKEEEDDKPQKIRLVHIDQIGKQGCVLAPDSDFLTLASGKVEKDNEDDDVFIAYNAAPIFKLPSRVAFKNHEGKYGGVTVAGTRYPYVEFKTSDIGGVGVAILLEQFPLMQPPRILCNHMSYGTWRLHWVFSTLVAVAVIANYDTPVMPVTPLRLAGNNVALQVVSKPGHFANCGADGGLENVLLATATSISQDAVFGVEEPVLFRAVSNVQYNLKDSRVYNISSVNKFRDERRNNTSGVQDGTFNVEYNISQTMTWSDSVSITTGVAASMSVSIPFVGVGFSVELSAERNKTVAFGKEQSESQTVTYSQNVSIPPGKKVTLLVVATRALCDVPFSCRVVDTISDGTIEPYTKTDGLFTGANEFSFQTELIEEDI